MNYPATTGAGRANIYDVAKLAGVSHMTVSRVLNGHPNIRDTTRKRVDDAIVQLQYQRSATARALAMRKAMRLGVLVDNPVEYGPNSMLHAFEAAAHEAGYTVGSFTTTDDGSLSIEAALQGLLEQDIDGLCMIAPRESSLQTLQAHPTTVPQILLIPATLPGVATASVDQYAGANLAVAHLIELGHERIAHLGGPADWFDARERKRGWSDALHAAGVPGGEYFEGNWTADCGYDWARSVDATRFTAVFVANDQMALGVIHGLAERGISVPGRVSVVGFDDVPDSSHYLPPLTTVRQDFVALGELAVSLLVEAIGGTPSAQQTKISPRLVVRESTAPPGMLE
ncbi:LacI family DNA-binding transcriptional regulator [Leucobacter sp. HY1910]